MATYKTYDTIGIREDLQDAIYDISPTTTPFMSTVGRTKAKNTYHEWQTDSLADVNLANAQVEGADAVSATLTPTTRVGNYTQISDMSHCGSMICVIASHQIILLCYSLARLLYVQNDDRDIYRYRDFQQDLDDSESPSYLFHNFLNQTKFLYHHFEHYDEKRCSSRYLARL